MATDREYPARKQQRYARLDELFASYDKVLVVKCDNVRSQQFHQIRISMRGKAQMVMGKNTLMKKVLKDRAKGGTDRDKLLLQRFVAEDLLKDNVGLIFFTGDVDAIVKAIEKNKVQAPARAGAISPVDVIIPPGNTGLDPNQTSFFQTLNIPTKISKGTVELLREVKILSVGQKVQNNEATLLSKLKINPFFYGLEILKVYDHGSVFGMDVLNMTEEVKSEKAVEAVTNVVALSLALGIPCAASLPHFAARAFQSLMALSLSTTQSFTEFGGAALKEAIKSGKATGPAPAAEKGGKDKKAAPPAAAPAPAPPPKPAPKEEEEEDAGVGGLFD